MDFKIHDASKAETILFASRGGGRDDISQRAALPLWKPRALTANFQLSRLPTKFNIHCLYSLLFFTVLTSNVLEFNSKQFISLIENKSGDKKVR